MRSQEPPHSCIVIGAGIAGLTAARDLRDAGIHVEVLEKARGVGGRMATRRFGGGVFDYGAQFVTVRDPQFARTMHKWKSGGPAVLWAHAFASAGGDPPSPGHPRYRGKPDMTALPKALAIDLDVRLGIRIRAVHRLDIGWRVDSDNGDAFRADSLILTPPVPQALSLLDAGGVTLSPSMAQRLEGISYHPCLALLVLFHAPTHIPAPGGLQFDQEPIRWMADNQQKGISPDTVAVTIHAAPGFSESHWEDDDESVAQQLLAAASQWLPPQPRGWQLHRWRYSQPVLTDPEHVAAYPYFAPGPPPLAFAGDAFAGGRVEGAALAGRRAAERILQSLTTH